MSGTRERAERIVANWRVNFGGDEDEPLINMIDAALIAGCHCPACYRVPEYTADDTDLAEPED